MNNQPTQMPGREFSVAALIEGLLPILILPGVCALVATAYWLGAGWLANPALGLPAGVWVVILAVAWARLVQERDRRTPAPLPDRSAARLDIAQSLGVGVGVRWPSNAAASRVLDTTASAASVGVRLARRTVARGVEETLCAWHDRLAWPTRPLRVGLGLTPDQAREIVECDGSSRVEWFMLPHGVTDPGACQRYVFDAVVCGGHHGGMTVFTSVTEGREASWYDWAGQRPLSYASVFPARADAERVTLDGAARAGSDPTLVRAIIESAGAFSRIGGRLGLTDRLRGRRPLGGLTRPSDGPDTVDECVARLGGLLGAGVRTVFGAGEQRVAARLVSACLATRPGGAEESERRRMAEDAAEVAGDEPEVMLRVAAVRIGAGDDSGGIAALLEADRLLRGRLPASGADQLLFVQSEFALGPVGRLALGRVAAGICLLAATSPAERLSYLRDDLLDEMRLAGWLSGADPDRLFLQEVFGALEKVRKPRPSRAARAA